MKKRVGRKHNLEVDLRSEIKRSIEREGVTLSFDAAYKEFRRECEMKEYSKYTIQFYDNELKYVRRHLVEIEAPLHDIGAIRNDDIYAIMSLLKSKGLKPLTIHARMRAIRALLNWAVDRKHIKVSPLDGVSLPNIKHKVGTTLTKSQLKKLLDAPDLTTFIGLRDYVLLLTFAHTGARVSEIADLKVQWVSFEDDAITFNRTKNGKSRRIPMSKQLNKSMRAWLKVRGTEIETDSLFITQYDDPMENRAMQRQIKYYSRKTGVEKEVPVSPHAFRRTFAKTMIQKGVDVFTVQALMGHSSLDQLKQYVMLYSEDLRKGIDAGF